MNLTEHQKVWELWRRLSLAVLSECCWWWLCSHVALSMHSPTGTPPHWSHLGFVLHKCQARAGSELQGGGSELPIQAAGFVGLSWSMKVAGRPPLLLPSIQNGLCLVAPSPSGKITTTTGHHSILCSKHQPSHSFCSWECYKHAKNSLWTWRNNAGNNLPVLWGKFLIKIINNLKVVKNA